MKLSVVIPVYNGAEFIKKSYDSIVNQNLDDFEIIYVDNNSTDTTVENITKILSVDSRVALYQEIIQGAGPTRNLGIKKAKGEFIYMYDVDDEIYPKALRNLISVLESHPNVDAVFGKMKKSHQGISNISGVEEGTLEIILKEKPYWGLKWFSNLKYVVGPPAFLYRASVFKKIGAYNTDLRVGQDTAFDIKLGMLTNIAFLDMYVYLYLKHDKSTTQMVKKKTTRAFMVWPRLIKEHLPFYLENEVPARFKQLLFAQIFQSMGRQLQYTKGFQNRVRLKKQLLLEIKEIPVPSSILFFLSILVLFPFAFVRKFYGYYIVRPIVQRITS